MAEPGFRERARSFPHQYTPHFSIAPILHDAVKGRLLRTCPRFYFPILILQAQQMGRSFSLSGTAPQISSIRSCGTPAKNLLCMDSSLSAPVSPSAHATVIPIITARSSALNQSGRLGRLTSVQRGRVSCRRVGVRSLGDRAAGVLLAGLGVYLGRLAQGS